MSIPIFCKRSVFKIDGAKVVSVALMLGFSLGRRAEEASKREPRKLRKKRLLRTAPHAAIETAIAVVRNSAAFLLDFFIFLQIIELSNKTHTTRNSIFLRFAACTTNGCNLRVYF